ncbi:MAG TPA: PAS domain S-box protein [Acidimicrobiales bacterium]|nr:PAS domain S-box protein [Acidimicrobiales bacterium]
MNISPNVDPAQLLDALFSASPDAVIVVDEDARILLASPAVESLFQYASEELIGELIETLVPLDRQERHEDHLRHYFKSPHPRGMGVGLELSGRRRDGSEIPIDVSLTPVKLEGRNYVAAYVRDAREQRRQIDRLHAVNEITRHLLTGKQMEDILPLVTRSARILSYSEAAWIVTPKSDTHFQIVAVDGPGTECLLGEMLSAETSRSAEVMRSGASEVIEDLYTATNVPEGVIELGLGPGLYVPFIADDRRLGTLVLGRLRGEPNYQPIDVAFAEVFAGAAATAIVMGSTRTELERLKIVAEDERIARDLHDTVIQELFALGMSLQATGASANGPIGERIAAAVDGLDDVIKQIRNTIFRLPGQSRGSRGLREEMLTLGDKYLEELGVLPRIVFDGPVETMVSETVTEDLLQVFGEGLSNIARHAHAKRIDAVVALEGEWLVFSLMDDGIGVTDRLTAGNGLRNMTIRAENHGGTCTISQRAPKGSILSWRVPLSS